MWAMMHVPVVLLVYAPSIRQALADVPAGYDAALWPAFALESALLLTVAFLIGLPLSLAGRVYRFAAPALVGLVTVALAVDSQVYRALGFHINGLVVRVLLQPRALAETGIPVWEVAAAVAAAALWLAGEVWHGAAP
jgi:membrane-anchored protein YejM (alkaline phosphatase superfamily)